MIEIFGTTTIYKNKITVLSEIRKRFGFHDGTKLLWGINRNGDLVIKKADSISNEYF